MPIKISKSQKIKDRQTGKMVTTHHYAKCTSIEELHDLITKESTKANEQGYGKPSTTLQ